ncbi:STAS domain-containing protein [Enhygromyxa salina]|uniref:RsbT co-antagonist protein RsbRA n=1 Tax=Enhygromyxa salina TaxID=215803 RepID=A0A2S9Y2H3_9BACT|nr:STAS domain-containing protein [Enhygromyxa salina]PRP99312.1 RsbT co-antagonist protein RsbRA [Enhygromyxa salina]
MTDTSADSEPRIKVDGNEFLWQREAGLLRISGAPSLALWIESSLAGLMKGMQHMVGTDRFNVAMQSGGRDSVDGDWGYLSRFDTFEEGLDQLGILANTCGWGRWSLISIDREAQVARFRVTNGWEALYQTALGCEWGSTFMAGKFAGLCTKLFGTNCWATQTRMQARGEPCDEFEVRPSTNTIERELEALLSGDKATRADLAVALQQLQREVSERQRAEREATRRLEMIESQRRDIDALTTPIMQIWDRVLTLPILGSLTGERAEALTQRLLSEIQRTQARFAILDITGVEVIDTNTANHLIRVTRTVSLLGATCVITGTQPAVAQTMVAIETNFGAVVTLATLRDGLEYCMRALSTPH